MIGRRSDLGQDGGLREEIIDVQDVRIVDARDELLANIGMLVQLGIQLDENRLVEGIRCLILDTNSEGSCVVERDGQLTALVPDPSSVEMNTLVAGIPSRHHRSHQRCKLALGSHVRWRA